MSDAIVVFHPADPSALEPLLDLDDDASDSPNPFAEKLADGLYLVHTFQPFTDFTDDPESFGTWLEHFAAVLDVVHDDPRGFFVYPDDHEPEATEYAALLEELGDAGAFFALDGLDAEDDLGIDLGALGALASQLMPGGVPNGSFEIGQLLQSMQEQIAGALGVSPTRPDQERADDDDREE